MFTTTAYDIWRGEQRSLRITTLCSELDEKLGGGIEKGKISEICGGPGTGKTQLCLQLCITVQFPTECGGINGKAVFIDTNQDFSPYRLKELAEHISKRLGRIFQNKSSATSFSIDDILKNVSYIYCRDIKQILAHLLLLRNTLKSDEKIKLVVVDSLSSLIRNISDVSERTRILCKILTEFHELGNEFQIAVVITNELTTDFNGKVWKIRPSLGNTHVHKINNRIIMSKFAQKNNSAFVAKSSVCKKIEIPVQLTNTGVRSLR